MIQRSSAKVCSRPQIHASITEEKMKHVIGQMVTVVTNNRRSPFQLAVLSHLIDFNSQINFERSKILLCLRPIKYIRGLTHGTTHPAALGCGWGLHKVR